MTAAVIDIAQAQADREHERDIMTAYMGLISAKTPEERQQVRLRFEELIKSRSAERVAKMERDMGLSNA